MKKLNILNEQQMPSAPNAAVAVAADDAADALGHGN